MFRTKHGLLATTMLVGALLVGSPPLATIGSTPASAQAASLSISVFFDDLQPHGSWIRHDRYQYVWVPAAVAVDWSPYVNGHWIYLQDYGWYFESEEPFAPITYHYGRWGYADDIGWYWVPGTVWAPAWVTWRQNDDYVGWAPMPPTGPGYAVGFSVSVSTVPQNHWHFVEAPRFLEPNLKVVVIAGRDRPDVYQRTRQAGAVTVRNNIVINNVITINFIQQKTNRRVDVQVAEKVDDPRQAERRDNGRIRVVTGQLRAPERNAKPQQTVELKDYRAARANTDNRGDRGNENRDGRGGDAPATVPGNPGNAGVGGNRPVGPASPRCEDATFARNNPRDCNRDADREDGNRVGNTNPARPDRTDNDNRPGNADGQRPVTPAARPPGNDNGGQERRGADEDRRTDPPARPGGNANVAPPNPAPNATRPGPTPGGPQGNANNANPNPARVEPPDRPPVDRRRDDNAAGNDNNRPEPPRANTLPDRAQGNNDRRDAPTPPANAAPAAPLTAGPQGARPGAAGGANAGNARCADPAFVRSNPAACATQENGGGDDRRR